MTTPGTSSADLRVLVLDDGDTGRGIADDLAPALRGIAEVAAGSPAAPPDGRGLATALMLLVVGAHSPPVDAIFTGWEADPDPAEDDVLILTACTRLDDLAGALHHDRVAAVLTLPSASDALASQARSHIARWLPTRAPDDPRLTTLHAGGRPLELPDSGLLRDLEMDDVAVATRLVSGIEHALGVRPRITVPAGTRLTRKGHSVDAVFVLLRGSVALEGTTRAGPLRLHHDSTGPVIGLLSLAQQRRAFFTAITTTEAELVHLSLEQLDIAMRQELEDTRDELDRQARLVSLGELAAGVAHELDNPVAALTRAASYVADDAARLVSETAESELAGLVDGARSRPPLTTVQERAHRRRIGDATGDADLARLLVSAGITEVDETSHLVGAVTDREQLAAAVGLGSALRNLEVAASRITELVTSLRTFPGPGVEQVDGVDLLGVVDDALRLVEHRLDDTTIHREYAPMRPLRGHPAELGQVVTNLLANATDAMEGRGTVTVRTMMDGDDAVLEVVDDGPGIPADELERLDEPRFTTKRGTVRFGLGLGLSVVRRIIDAHGGRFRIRSQPGRTVAEVRLPTGVDLLVHLHADHDTAGVRKVLVTGQADHDDTIRAVNEAGLDHYIAEPWHPEDLLTVVREQLTAFVIDQDLDPLPHLAVRDAAQVMPLLRDRGDR